eukprot:gene6400-7134_t
MKEIIREIIREEMTSPGMLAGYRTIWHALRLRHQIHIPRHFVAAIMKDIDPDGLNSVENEDSNVEPSFLKDQTTLKELGGCPKQLISDRGTENGIAAAMQCKLRESGIDVQQGFQSHRYCSSPANQRIEGWWSFYRCNRSSWWIDFFKCMADSGILLLGANLHMECLWLCFGNLINKDIAAVRDHWNSHWISKNRYATVHGIPDVMYFLPEYHNRQNCLVNVPDNQLDELQDETFRISSMFDHIETVRTTRRLLEEANMGSTEAQKGLEEELYGLKNEVEDSKIMEDESPEQIEVWGAEVDQKLRHYEEVIDLMNHAIGNIEDEREKARAEKEKTEEEHRLKYRFEEEQRIEEIRLREKSKEIELKASAGKEREVKIKLS